MTVIDGRVIDRRLSASSDDDAVLEEQEKRARSAAAADAMRQLDSLARHPGFRLLMGEFERMHAETLARLASTPDDELPQLKREAQVRAEYADIYRRLTENYAPHVVQDKAPAKAETF